MREIYKVSLLGICLLGLGISLDAQEQKQPSAAELSKSETPGKAFTRSIEHQEYEFRSAAEAMPKEKWDYRPAPGYSRTRSQNLDPVR